MTPRSSSWIVTLQFSSCQCLNIVFGSLNGIIRIISAKGLMYSVSLGKTKTEQSSTQTVLGYHILSLAHSQRETDLSSLHCRIQSGVKSCDALGRQPNQ